MNKEEKKATRQSYGEELANRILDGYLKQKKVTLRVNNIKASVEEMEKKLEKNNIVFVFWAINLAENCCSFLRYFNYFWASNLVTSTIFIM